MTRGDFETSLYYNILFGSSRLVMPDVFFFNCTPLLSHLQTTPGRLPFFVQAVRKGLVVPAFRSREVVTFSKSLEELGGDQIRGVEREQFDLSKVARLLDRSYPDDRQPAVWQSNMGGRFEALVDRVFNEPADRIHDDELRHLWEATRDWRLRGVEGAKQLTHSLGGTGLRRAEIWNFLGRWLGILDKGGSFNKPAEFIQAAGTSPELAKQASFIVDVTNICYQLNQASGLELLGNVSEPNVPRVLSRPAETVIPGLQAPGIWHSPTNVFAHVVRVPRVSAMLKTDSVRLLEVRDGEKGLSYRYYRNEWMFDPSERNEQDLRKAADKYAHAIRNVAKGAQESTRIVQVSNAARTVMGGSIGALVGSLGNLIGAHQGYVLVTSLAGVGAGASAIVKNTTVPKSQKYAIEAHSYRPAEYNLGQARYGASRTAAP